MTMQIRTKKITLTLTAIISEENNQKTDFIAEAIALAEELKMEAKEGLDFGETVDATVVVEDGPTYQLTEVAAGREPDKETP